MTRNTTRIPIAALALTAIFGLAACSATTATQPSTVAAAPTVSATPSPSTSPSVTPTPTPVPAPGPSGSVTAGETFTLSVPVGSVFQIPVEGGTPAMLVDIQYDAASTGTVTTELPRKQGIKIVGDVAMDGSGVMMYATGAGQVTGAVRVLDPVSGLPTGDGTTFAVEVTS